MELPSNLIDPEGHWKLLMGQTLPATPKQSCSYSALRAVEDDGVKSGETDDKKGMCANVCDE